jgi:DNA sulfur modification protein DndD
MIIKKLKLHNFGVYAGTNVFDFKADKPIVLIGGLNGRGKTTFLEAVLLALYGKNSFAYTEGKGVTYGQYLLSYVNVSDGTKETFVELTFCMKANGTEKYKIKREWNGNGARTIENISVFKDDEYNQFLTDNWAMFMENVLPSALSSFFFFDGEKISNQAGENTSTQMKESIKALLGITVLDHLENDLYRVISRAAKSKVESDEAVELEKLRKAKEDATEKLALMDEKIAGLLTNLSEVQHFIDRANEEYIAKGGDIVNQRQDLMEKRSVLRAKTQGITDELLIASASELPLLLVKNLLSNIRKKAEIEHDQKTNSIALEKMLDTIPTYIREEGGQEKEIKSFLNYFKKKMLKENNVTFDLSDSTLVQVQLLLDHRLKDKKNAILDAHNRMQKNMQESDQIESFLSVDIDEKAIAALYKKIKKLEQKKTDIEAKIEIAQEKRKSLNGELILASSDFNRKVEAYLKKVELNEDRDRIIKYANLATNIIEKYRVALQTNKISEVAKTMTCCYKQLSSKKTLIDRIEMDPLTLNLFYLNKDGIEVPGKSLSAGEKQMMVTALLWSLAICSNKRLPVIIDTPLSRLDSVHRQALINIYFPKASDQTIILSTDSEINNMYYNMMKSNIGDEFTLVYDERSKSTTIKRGYRMENAK